MRIARTAGCVALALALVCGVGGCSKVSGSDSGKVAKASRPEDLLTAGDVQRILRVKKVTRSQVGLNPDAQYQAIFEGDGKRLVIINVLGSKEWDTLASIGETRAVEALGDRALRSSTYGAVFTKGDRLIAIGGFGEHPGGAETGVPFDTLLELALLVESRM